MTAGNIKTYFPLADGFHRRLDLSRKTASSWERLSQKRLDAFYESIPSLRIIRF